METLSKEYVCRKCGVHPEDRKQSTIQQWSIIYDEKYHILDSICPLCIRRLKLEKIKNYGRSIQVQQ